MHGHCFEGGKNDSNHFLTTKKNFQFKISYWFEFWQQHSIELGIWIIYVNLFCLSRSFLVNYFRISTLLYKHFFVLFLSFYGVLRCFLSSMGKVWQWIYYIYILMMMMMMMGIFTDMSFGLECQSFHSLTFAECKLPLSLLGNFNGNFYSHSLTVFSIIVHCENIAKENICVFWQLTAHTVYVTHTNTYIGQRNDSSLKETGPIQSTNRKMVMVM